MLLFLVLHAPILLFFPEISDTVDILEVTPIIKLLLTSEVKSMSNDILLGEAIWQHIV